MTKSVRTTVPTDLMCGALREPASQYGWVSVYLASVNRLM